MVDKHTSTIISLLLFGVSGFLCSFFFTGGMGISYAPAIIFTSLAIFAGLPKGERLELPFHSFLFGLFWLYAGASFLWSNTPYISLVSFLILSIVPISYLLVTVLYKRYQEKGIRSSIHILVGFGVLFSLYGFWNFYTGNQTRLSSFFANPNSFSALVILCLIPCAILLTHETKRALLWGGLSFLLLATLIFTGSRSGLVTLSVALALILFLSSSKKTTRTAIALLGGYIVIAIASYWFDMRFITRILETFSQAYSDSTQGRLTIWTGSWALAKDNLLYGTGFGTFFLSYPPYRLPMDPSVGDWAHWDSLQILSEVGILGALLWGSFWIAFACSIFQNRQSLTPYALVGATCCFAFFVQGHMTYLYLTFPILFIMGASLAIYDTNSKHSQTIMLSRSPIFIGLIIIIFLAAQSAISILLTQQAQSNMFKGKAELGFETIDYIESYGSPSFYEHQLVAGRRGDIEALKIVQKRCKPCASPDFIQGLIALQSKDIKQAKSFMWEAMRKDPSDQNIRVHFVQVLLQQERLLEAEIVAEQGLLYPSERQTKDFYKDVISKSQKIQ